MFRKALTVLALCFLLIPLAAAAQPVTQPHQKAANWLTAIRAFFSVLWSPGGIPVLASPSPHCSADSASICPAPPQLDGGCSVDPNGCPKP